MNNIKRVAVGMVAGAAITVAPLVAFAALAFAATGDGGSGGPHNSSEQHALVDHASSGQSDASHVLVNAASSGPSGASSVAAKSNWSKHLYAA